MSAPLSLIETADLLGRYRYVELAMFARLGRRALDCERADLVVYLEGASLAHAFRAGLVEASLPNAPSLAERDWTRSPGAGFDEALEVLVAPGEDEDLARAVVEVVYPAMAAAYGAHLEVCTPLGDAPVSRTLRRCLSDLAAVRADAPVLGGDEGGRSRRVGELLSSIPGPFGPLVGSR